MLPDFDDIPPELQPLYRALAECGIAANQIAQTVERLIPPPLSFHISASDNDATKLATLVFDGDVAARMLRLNEGHPDSEAKWKTLTRSERKQAKRLIDFALGPDNLGVTPQGRPSKTDAAIVVYCVRVLREACGVSRFEFSRPPDGGAPRGPMWRALMAALPVVELSLARMVGAPAPTPSEITGRAETVAEIVKAARSAKFAEWCQHFGLGPSSNDVAGQPATFRYAMSLARRARQRAPRT
jgi:hypothetical protein